MHSFHYQNGSLHCGDVDLAGLADEHGTPAYVYSATTIRDHYCRLDQALAGLDHGIEYAVKAYSNLSVLKLLVNEGSGFDIVSGGELRRVIEAGGDPGKCTFAGVGKTREEIEYAINEGIYCFNAESEADEADEASKEDEVNEIDEFIEVQKVYGVDKGDEFDEVDDIDEGNGADES